MGRVPGLSSVFFENNTSRHIQIKGHKKHGNCLATLLNPAMSVPHVAMDDWNSEFVAGWMRFEREDAVG